MFPNLKRALKEYERTAKARQRLWDTAQTDADVQAAVEADEEARKKLCVAFHADTKKFNSLERCMLLGVKRLIELGGRSNVRG